MSHATIPNLIRDRLLSVPEIASKLGARIHYQHIPQSSQYPHVYYTRRGSNTEELMDADGILRDRFVVEVVTRTFDDALITAITDSLFFDGIELGSRCVATSDLDEADDDYVFESAAGDSALCMHAFVLTLYIGGE